MDELWNELDYYDTGDDSDSNSSDDERISGVDGDTDAPDGLMQLDNVETEENQTVQSQHEGISPQTLLETCARFIGQNFPFELVQLHPQRVPEEVQKRITYWSFPLEEKCLVEYAKMMGVSEHTISRVERVLDSKNNDEHRTHRDKVYYGYQCSVDFNKPIQDIVKMTQIGMHLTGTMEDLDRIYYSSAGGHHSTTHPFSLCVQFDRGCITSAMCSCHSSSKWCEHVIMLCIARIRGIVPCEIHPPMSEILSQFNRDQLQKLIQHFLEKVPLVGIPPVMALACQLKDKESEVNKQHGAPDLTAGGCVSEVAQWQIDDNIIIARLDKDFRNLDNSTNANIHNFKDFTMFLRNHDGNVITAFKWFLETIKMFHKHLSMFGHTEDQHGSYYHSPTNQLYPTANRYPFYLVLMQGLQIFFVDPFISKSCKKEIADQLKSQDAFTLSEPLTEQYTGLLQEAVVISEKSPRPTIHYIQKLKLTLQGDTGSTECDFGEGSSDSRILFSCLVAVLRYWIFHKHPFNPACSVVALDVCKWVFPVIPLATSTFEDLVAINKHLEGIQLSSLLRHGQVLMEYLIHSRVDQHEIVGFVTKLLGASSVEMSAIIQTTSEDTFILITRVEEAILCLAQKHVSCERELFTPVLRQIVTEYLYRDVGEGVFVWPWSLLRLAALDPVMVEKVKEVTQNFIGNANSVLHCTSQTDQVYPPHVVDHVRDSLLSLLQHLFNTLELDSAQVLFTTLSDAFPFPITYSAGHSLPDELQNFPRRIDYEIQELQELKKRMKIGVLPNLQCDPSFLCLVQQDGRFVEANKEIQSILLKAINAMFSIDRKHVMFVEKLVKLTTFNRLSFQLKILYLCVNNSMNGLYGRSLDYNYHTNLNINHNIIQVNTPSGCKAFLYLADKWQYCLDPSDVLEFIAHRFSGDLQSNGTTGSDEVVARLISTVVLANANAVRSIYPLGSLVRILAQSENIPSLLVFADAFDAKSEVVNLELVGRALGQQYSKLKARTEGATSDNTILARLKTKCMAILQIMVSREYEHHLYGNVLTSETAIEWAPIVCAFGEDAVKKFLTVLQWSHKVNSLGKFPYSFCEDLGNLWREYSATLPSASTGILGVPVFEKIMTHLLPEKEKNTRNTIRKYSNNTKRVKEAMLLLASIYQPLQLEKEFKKFASKMFVWCSKGVWDMIVREFIRTPISVIKIPPAMLRRLSELDKQGTARHHMDVQERYSPKEEHRLPNSHRMGQYYAIGRGGQSKRMKI